MEKSEELHALRSLREFLVRNEHNTAARWMEALDTRIADLAADEEVALTLKRSIWEGVIKCLREKWHGAAADMLRTQLDATP